MTGPRGPRILEQEALLNRQVHHTAVQQNRVTKQAFYSSSNPYVSVDRQRLMSPEESYEYFTVQCQKTSAGTWCLTVGEVEQEQLEAHEDPEPGPVPPANPAHAVIVGLHALPRKEAERRATRLAECVNRRRCVYTPTKI